MRQSHILVAVLAALALGGCMQRHVQPTAYVMDPQTGQMMPVVAQQRQFTQPVYQQQAAPVYQPQAAPQALYSSSPAAVQQSYGEPVYARPQYGQPAYAPPRAAVHK